MGKTLEGFLSDDGQSFTSLVENDDVDVDEGKPNDDGTSVDKPVASDQIDELLGKIKVENLSEDQRVLFTQLSETVKNMKTELSGVKKDSDIGAVLQKIVERLNQSPSTPTTVNKQVPVKKDRLFDQLKFDNPEQDYYAPHLKILASAIDKMTDNIDGIGKRFDESTKNTFVKNVQSFVRINKIPETVIRKMDEIAREFGPGSYNNLERLYKYAKVELGIKDAPTNLRMVEGGDRKKVVEFGGKRRTESVIDNKPAKTMQEAWAQAERQLAEND